MTCSCDSIRSFQRSVTKQLLILVMLLCYSKKEKFKLISYGDVLDFLCSYTDATLIVTLMYLHIGK